MTISVDVSVEWLGPRAKTLFTGHRYTTVSKFPENDWPKNLWSVVLEFDKTPAEQGNPSKGRASFLFDEAPVERLRTGATFELYEGHAETAKVTVV